MERVNTEDSPYELSLEITASGNAQNLIAGSSAYSAITESDARLASLLPNRTLAEIEVVFPSGDPGQKNGF